MEPGDRKATGKANTVKPEKTKVKLDAAGEKLRYKHQATSRLFYDNPMYLLCNCACAHSYIKGKVHMLNY